MKQRPGLLQNINITAFVSQLQLQTLSEFPLSVPTRAIPLLVVCIGPVSSV